MSRILFVVLPDDPAPKLIVKKYHATHEQWFREVLKLPEEPSAILTFTRGWVDLDAEVVYYYRDYEQISDESDYARFAGILPVLLASVPSIADDFDVFRGRLSTQYRERYHADGHTGPYRRVGSVRDVLASPETFPATDSSRAAKPRSAGEAAR